MITPTVCLHWGLLYLDDATRKDYTLQCSSGDLYLEGKEAGKALVNLKEKTLCFSNGFFRNNVAVLNLREDTTF